MAKILDTFPDPQFDLPGPGRIVLAAGCFWCTEGVFRQMPGVTDVISGYAGGDPDRATYYEVGAGDTGHAEAIEIHYDPALVTLGQILKTFFWLAHDPTQVNGQGANMGSQYRSAIFYADEQQHDIARRYIDQLNDAHVFNAPVATTLEKLTIFHRAEDIHQNYAALNAGQPYVRNVSQPKIDRTRKVFSKA